MSEGGAVCGYRVTSVEVLGALPAGSVVLVEHDMAWGEVSVVAKQSDGWYGAWGWECPIRVEEIVPCVVLYEPE